MTRLNLAVTGDPLTFRPVSSSIVRKSKDGDVSVVILLFGTHYNISMSGILQQNQNNHIDTNTAKILTIDGKLNIIGKQKNTSSEDAHIYGSFGSFMYFYKGTGIEAHLELDEGSHILPVPKLEGYYEFSDLLSEDKLIFKLIRNQNDVKFSFIEEVDGTETELFGETLETDIKDIWFEFKYLENGKSKLYTFTNHDLKTATKTRKWLGNIKAKIGECRVSSNLVNGEKVDHKFISDAIFIKYPEIYLNFDRTSTERFVGQIKMFDDLNEVVENKWKQIRSRDHKFIGNRIIENGMIRIIIKTNNPVIEIWGWNYNSNEPSWEKNNGYFDRIRCRK